MLDIRSWMPHHRQDPAVPWETLARTALILVAILLPVFVLPITGDRWDIHKSLILLAGVTIAWLGYIGTALIRRQTVWTWHRFDIVVLGWLGAIVVSALFSVDRTASLTGFLGNYQETVPVTVALISLYFLQAKLFHERHLQWVSFAAVGVGVGVALLVQVFQLANLSLLPFDLSRDQTFSVISNNGLDTPLIAALLALALLYHYHRVKEKSLQLLLIGGVVIALMVMFFFGQAVAWAAFAIGMIGLVMLESKLGLPGSLRRIVLAVVLAGAGMIIQFTDLPARSGVPQPVDIRVDQGTSTAIAWQTIAKRPVFGSGPATWYHDFVQYRPTSFNASPFWAERFIKARSGWSQLLATVGLVGVLVWAAVLGWSIWWLWRIWQRAPNPWTTLALAVAALTASSGFFLPWSLTWLVIFWLILGLARTWLTPDMSRRPIGLGVPLGLAMVVLLAVVFWYPAVKHYTSEVLLEQSRQAVAQTKPLAGVIADLEFATQLAPRNLDALLFLAQGYEAEGELLALNGQTEKASTRFEQSLSTARQAIAAHPKNPVPYEVMNNLLNRLASQIAGVADEAGQNFEQLRKLEPSNPVHDIGYGQILLLQRDIALAGQSPDPVAAKTKADGLLKNALAIFASALEKKPDYLQARFARAQALTAGEQYAAALEDLTVVAGAATDVPQYWQQLGIVLSKLDRAEEAVQAFDRSISLDPQNPMIYLAYSQHYQDAGDKTKAKEILGRGLEAIPDDPRLKSALEAL